MEEIQKLLGEGGSTLLMFVLMFVVFYLFMIRPQMKRTKEAKQFRESIATGDKIVTIGGIHGKILEVAETTILISSEGTKLRIEKSSISPNSIKTKASLDGIQRPE